MPNIQKAVDRMRFWCAFGNLGYDQRNRWDIRIGGECDCSSLVIWVLREAGFDTGNATYTGNLSAALTSRGWKRLSPSTPPQAGDILLNDVHHVALYLGNGQLGQASIDERGRASGGASGDQTNETNIRGYYNYPWNCILRYVGNQSNYGPAPTQASSDIDGRWGKGTTILAQKVMGTTQDGIVSSQSNYWRGANEGLTTGWEWVDPNRAVGSRLIAQMQIRMNIKPDGLVGPKFIRALQVRMGTPQDGVLSDESLCIMELQRRLKRGTF